MYMPVDVIRTRYARNTSVKFLTRLSVHLPSPVLLYSWPMSLALRQPCTACIAIVDSGGRIGEPPLLDLQTGEFKTAKLEATLTVS